MFKCWVSISGESHISIEPVENVSDKSVDYGKSNKTELKEKNDLSFKESSPQNSYFPGVRKFGFFDRFVRFS